MDSEAVSGEGCRDACTERLKTCNAGCSDFGVPFGESSDTEMCYQFAFAYPAHALANGAPSLLGVPDTCW